MRRRRTLAGAIGVFLIMVAVPTAILLYASPRHRVSPSPRLATEVERPEYIWLEAENMRGIATTARREPVLNPSWMDLPKAKAPGWGINGPGVSAEWTQGGESEWNSVAASADETNAAIVQHIVIARAGDYNLWVRYADWANRNENFAIRIVQNGRDVWRHEFGANDVVDPHDEVSMYWGWSFTWDNATVQLAKGPATLRIEIDKATEARRHVDCLLLTNDLKYVAEGRRKPDFAAARYLRDSAITRAQIPALVNSTFSTAPQAWQRPTIAGRDFLMPWNIAREFWAGYDNPKTERPLYPFNAEPIDEFIKTYKGAADVPLFSSKLVVPVIYINDLPQYLKEGSPFLRFVRETKSPFAILINYGAVQFTEAEGQAAWTLLSGELKDQFLGFISGESVGYVWDASATELKISPEMTRTELLAAHKRFYTQAIARKWSNTFHVPTGALWNKLIPAQSTSSTSFAHALMDWGTNLLGIETAAVQPMTAMRLAFTRGAARQFGGKFLYYHAPNFGDSATTFTKAQNFAGPDNFFHSRYGTTMGPSLSWYRKSYFLYYMGGASAIYLEQGGDQFFKPGPGEHPFQLNPLGRITQEFMRFAEKHPDRGIPYTPVAFLLDPAHGFEMTDYPHWPFGVSQINRSDRALRELFGTAYYPGLVVEGEPASGDRQAFVSSVFGDIFDVVVAQDVQRTSTTPRPTDSPLSPYRVVVVGGQINWTPAWVTKLDQFVRGGGVLVLNAAQVKGLPVELTGVELTDETVEADRALCSVSSEAARDLSGQMFRYQKIRLRSANPLMSAPNGDALVTVNKLEKGIVVFSALPDLLGEDERVTPFVAHMLEHAFAGVLPVNVNGDVEYLINRNERGWVVTLINNNGVFKPQQGMAQVDRKARATAVLTLKGLNIANEWINKRSLPVKGDSVTVELAPGGIAVVELVGK